MFKIKISWNHQVLSDRNAAFLKNTNVYAYFILRKCYPSLKGLLPLWKELHMFIKIYGRQNALVLKECYAHLRVLLYTFSKECCSLYRRMLHRGMPQLPQEMPHSFKFSTMTYEKHAVALRIWVDAVLGFNNTFFQRNNMLTLAKHSISLYVGSSVRKMQYCLGTKWNLLSIKSAVSSCSCLL